MRQCKTSTMLRSIPTLTRVLTAGLDIADHIIGRAAEGCPALLRAPTSTSTLALDLGQRYASSSFGAQVEPE